jgi:hypothetical protein
VGCGLGFRAAIGSLECGRPFGARAAEVLDYRTSGDVSGEGERVVGYAAVAVLEPGGGGGDCARVAAMGVCEAGDGRRACG